MATSGGSASLGRDGRSNRSRRVDLAKRYQLVSDSAKAKSLSRRRRDTEREIKMSNDKKRVFISYGHKDGFDFVRRLAFSLEMYIDVFWDKRLRDGAFDTQLYQEIEKCDYFLMVMTPYALREDGWCRIELADAEKKNKRIVPIKLHDNCGFPDLETQLENPEKIQYADFEKDFDKGFQSLTQILLGHPFLSWEYCALLPDEKLLEQLKEGRLPVVIAKEIVEWVIIHKTWLVFTDDIEERNVDIDYPSPKTSFGVYRALEGLSDAIESANDVIAFVASQRLQEILLNYAKPLNLLRENAHQKAGELAFEIISRTKDFSLDKAVASNNVRKNIFIDSNFDFEVAEQLREFINTHARRSRYLY
jgi:hypothetical protein